uniref:Uncharacterized protein n=1 Tax=viral metagenome TaxID=1070528 RepID=A0A6C0ET22_9ZZZZ
MEQNAPEKKIPSTHANASNLVPKEERLSLIHLIAQSAFFLIQGKLSNAVNNLVFSTSSLMYVSMRREYVSLCPVNIPLNIPV